MLIREVTIKEDNKDYLTEAAQGVLLMLLRSWITKIGWRKFIVWLLKWLFTSAIGLSIMAVLTFIQIIAGLVAGGVGSVASAGFKKLIQLLKDSGEDGNKVLSDLEAEIKAELDMVEDQPEKFEKDLEDQPTQKELVKIVKDELTPEEIISRSVPELA
jgi:hypothetical protein